MKRTQFKKGQSGNPAGRPPGALNRIAKPVKERISDFLTEKFGELPTIWERLEPKEQARLLVDLLPYSVPKMQAIQMDADINFSNMSENDLDEIVKRLLDNENRQ